MTTELVTDFFSHLTALFLLPTGFMMVIVFLRNHIS